MEFAISFELGAGSMLMGPVVRRSMGFASLSDSFFFCWCVWCSETGAGDLSYYSTLAPARCNPSCFSTTAPTCAQVNAVLEDVAKQQIGAFEKRCRQLSAAAEKAAAAKGYASAFAARLRPPSPPHTQMAINCGPAPQEDREYRRITPQRPPGLSPTGTPLTGRILER